MTDLSAAAALFARIAYSTLHAVTLMIGALKKSAASGLIPNADTKKINAQKQDETAEMRPLFFRVNPPADLR